MLNIRKIIDQKHLLLDTALSLVLIIAVFYFIGIDAILREFTSINYYYLTLSIIFLLLMYLGMTTRLVFILTELGEKPNYWEVFKMHFVGMLLADFTPGRTGYFAVAYGLTKKHGIPEEKSIVAVMGPQIYDFALKVIVGTFAIFYILNTYLKIDHGEIMYLGAIVMTGMIVVMALLLFSKQFLSFLSFARRISIADKVLTMFEKAQQNSHIVLHHFPALFLILIFCWAMKAISWYFVAKALNINLSTDFPEILIYFFLQPLLTMLEFLPSPTLAGLGLSEGGGVLIFSIFGVGAAKAVSFVFLARVKTIIVNLLATREAISLLTKPRGKLIY